MHLLNLSSVFHSIWLPSHPVHQSTKAGWPCHYSPATAFIAESLFRVHFDIIISSLTFNSVIFDCTLRTLVITSLSILLTGLSADVHLSPLTTSRSKFALCVDRPHRFVRRSIIGQLENSLLCTSIRAKKPIRFRLKSTELHPSNRILHCFRQDHLVERPRIAKTLVEAKNDFSPFRN